MASDQVMYPGGKASAMRFCGILYELMFGLKYYISELVVQKLNNPIVNDLPGPIFLFHLELLDDGCSSLAPECSSAAAASFRFAGTFSIPAPIHYHRKPLNNTHIYYNIKEAPFACI